MYKTIGVDCDDVLSQTMNLLLQTQYFRDRNMTFQGLTSYNLREIPKLELSREKSIQAFHDLFLSDQFREMKPISGALPVLQKRKKENKKLIIVTGRDLSRKEKTMSRIQLYFPDIFDDGLFAGENSVREKTKTDLCREAGIELMIEDRLPIVQELALNGIPSYLLDNPRNQPSVGESLSPLITRISSRSDLLSENI